MPASSSPPPEVVQGLVVEDLCRYFKQKLAKEYPEAPAAYAWDIFYAAYDSVLQHYVQIYARKYGVRRDRWDDLAQEVWSSVFQNFAKKEWDQYLSGFRAWLKTIIKNRSVDFIRHARAKEQANGDVELATLPDPRADLDALYEKAWEFAVLQHLLAELEATESPENVQILKLHYFSCWRDQDIAEHLEMTRAQVQARLHRQVGRVRQVVEVFTGVVPSALEPAFA